MLLDIEIGRCHYAKEPVELDRSRVYELPDGTIGNYRHWKPQGLWYSVGKGVARSTLINTHRSWREWVDENTGWHESLRYAHSVNIENAGIFYAMDKHDLIWIEEEYGVDNSPHGPLQIDWQRFAQRFDGIEIDFMPKEHLDRFWYYGWDCSSGVIWHLDDVELGPAVETDILLEAGQDCPGD